MKQRQRLPAWPATAYELAVEAIASGIELSSSEDGRLKLRGRNAEVERLSSQLRERREEIIALLTGRSEPAEVTRIASGPYQGFWTALRRTGPDPVRGGSCIREARISKKETNRTMNSRTSNRLVSGDQS